MIQPISYGEYFVPGEARNATRVPSDAGRAVAVVVSDVRDDVPGSVVVRTSGVAGNLNVAGTTSIATQADREALFQATVRLFGGDPSFPFRLHRIAIGSGGTRVLDKEVVLTGTMTAVEVPGIAYAIAKQRYPDEPETWPLTWGHTPRTHEVFGYGGAQSSFLLSDSLAGNTIVNPDLHLLWLLQEGASLPSGWDGDLEKYMALLELYRDSGEGFSGLLVLSGGVTAKEVLLALRADIPVLAAVGTGRAADALVNLMNGTLDQIVEENVRKQYEIIAAERLNLKNLVTLFDANQPVDGQRWLQQMGFGTIL